ncbi:4527_t:CDS:2, partial [Acaulospora morrowiae]
QDFLLREELQKLRAELVFLENRYKDVCVRNTRLKTFMRSHVEIFSLRTHVTQLQDILKENEIPVPAPPPPIPWVLDTTVRSPTWIINPEWSKLNPNTIPFDNPNNG